MKTVLRTLLCILLAAAYLPAQNNNGSISGSVTDPSGAAVAGATITAKNDATGLTVTVKSTDAGLYSLPNLPPGNYTISAELTGFQKYEHTGVTVQIATTTNLDVSLTMGAVTQTVTVKGGAPLIQTSTSSVTTNVQTQLISNLPLEVGGTIRNPVQFITLVPGFVGGVGNDPGSNSTDDYKLNGGQEGGTDILVDGVSISLVSPNTQQNKGISPEALQEFTVLQSNFSAEYGQSGDSIVNLSVKSGTNQLHGTVYDFLRNRVLDASGWTNNTACNGNPICPKPLDTQNDFGFLVSGPVVLPKIYDGHNKTFFMFDYEGFRFSTAGTNVTSYPTTAFRNGDFSSLCPAYDSAGFCAPTGTAAGAQLFDPGTGAFIPGNNLANDPNFQASSVMTNVFKLLPPPANSGITNNIVESSQSQTRANLWDLKVDQIISDKQRLSFGFDWDNTNTGYFVPQDLLQGSQTPQNTRYTRFNHEYIFTPSLLNHFLIGFSRRFRGELSNGIGQNYPQKLGLGGVQNTTFPCIQFNSSPYFQVLNNCGDSEFADNVYQVDDSISWIHGKHNFKFGGELRALQFNARRLTTSSGEFDFDPAETSGATCGSAAFQAAHPGVSCGDAVASSLFGLVHRGVLNYGQFSGVRYKNYAFYAQDNYKVTSHLTLNLGLRYDYDIPASEAFNRFSAVDPTLANPGAGGILGAYTYFGTGPGRNGRKRPQNTYAKGFGPRVGFAYSINDKTVIRGGYGIFYEPLKEGSFADQDSLGFFNRETLASPPVAPFQIDNGFPHLLPPSGPFTPDGQNGNSGVILVPPNSARPGDIQSWNLDVERQISNSMMVSVAYVGSKGTHLPALNIIPNQVNPSWLGLGNELGMDASCLAAGTCPNSLAAGVALPYAGFSGSVAQALRPFPQYGDFNQEDNSFTPDRTGNSTYHSMQTRITKRFSEGLSFLVSYTISKNITDADSMGPGVSGFIGTNAYIGQNSFDRRAEKAVSELDTPQSLVVSFFQDIPLGRGKRYLSNAGIADRLVSGWYVGGILHYNSGIPTAVYAPCSGTAGAVLFAGCEFTGIARANIVSGVPQTNKSGNFQPAATPFFNPNAFAVPAPFTFGNEPRSLDHARTFGGRNEDITLGKKTRLFGEKATLDFRAEFFNIFNRHIYQAPGGFATPLGTPFQAAGSDPANCPGPFSCGFGAVTSASGPRTIQFGLRITY